MIAKLSVKVSSKLLFEKAFRKKGVPLLVTLIPEQIVNLYHKSREIKGIAYFTSFIIATFFYKTAFFV